MFSTLHEALEHNRQTQNPYLDLGNLGLNGTEPEPELEQLKTFTWVETLIFSNEWSEFDVEKKKWIEQKSQNEGAKNKLTYLPALPPQTNRLICAGKWNNKFEISDFSFLKDLQNLQSLDLSFNQISDISPLKDLQNIQTLMLWKNQISDISPLKDLQNIQSLDLSENQISDISPLKDLLNIQSLYLIKNQISDISPLKDLQNIQTLYLSENQISDISPLKDLQNIQSLDLSLNQISDISPLKDLQNIQSLYLRFNQISDISPLKDLQNIQTLMLWKNQISDISPLKDLQNIQSLDLRDNQISDISPLKDLQNIQSLSLSDNLISDISPLKDLQNIQTLMLWKNQISDISPLKDLQNIQTLDLSENQISDISPLKDLQNIQTLMLWNNQISDISPLKDLQNIQTLYLSNNQISDISLAFLNNFPKLEKLYLYKNPIQNIPQEVFDKEDNVLPEVLAYLRAQAQGEIINTEAKAVCFGNGEGGKTTLSHQLRMGAFSAEVGKDRTHGILLHDWEIPYTDLPADLQQKIGNTAVKLRVWDFGGQEYYHATHRLFLNNNVLYLLVWDKATNRQDEAQGIYPLAYWRKNIQHYAPENITIEIQNKVGTADEATIKPQALQYKVANYYEDQDEYENDIKKLKKAIFNQLHRLKHLGKPFPKVYDDIRQVLRRQEEPFLPFAEYVALCEANDFTEDKIMREAIQIETLTNFLHETGAIICYRFKQDIAEALREYVFLRPAWVTDYIYEILAKELQGKGEFDLTHIAQKTTDSGISPDVWAELMQQFELIFEIEKTDEETEEKQKLYVAPQYLPTECTEKKAMRMAFKDKIISPVFTLQYPDFMPKSNFLRFVAKYGAQSVDYLYWKNGIVFFLAGKTVFAECRQVERQITIQIQDKDTYLAYQIFQTLYKIDNSEKLEISVNGQDFVNYKELKDCKFEGLTYAGKDFEKKDFAFLFGEMQGKGNFEKPDMNPHIQKALQVLQRANYAGYFEEMDKIIDLVPSQSVPYSRHKGMFTAGNYPFDFHMALEVFSKAVDKELSNQQKETETLKENNNQIQNTSNNQTLITVIIPEIQSQPQVKMTFILAVDIVGFSKGTDNPTQFNYFKRMISRFNEHPKLKEIPQDKSTVLLTGDGLAIAVTGEENAPALFEIADDIANDRTKGFDMTFALNAGQVNWVQMPNQVWQVIGQDVNWAFRILAFAGSNQVLIGTKYYDVVIANSGNRLFRGISNTPESVGTTKHGEDVKAHKLH